MPDSTLKCLTSSTIVLNSTSTTAGSLVLTGELRAGKASLQLSTLKTQRTEVPYYTAHRSHLNSLGMTKGL